MATVNSRSLVPSTSGTQPTQANPQTSPPVSNNEEELCSLQCLDIIAKVAAMLKNENNEFIAILEKLLVLVDGHQSKRRNLTYSLINEVISNILEADKDELEAAKEYFDRIFFHKKFKDMVIRENQLEHLGFLGEGGFSVVLKGKLSQNGSVKDVAVKRAKTFHYNNIIEHEATVLAQLNHKNLVKLLGKHESEPEIILELMSWGNLVSAVERIRFTTQNLLKFLEDVASGMEYMVEKKYLHRDLACRNVFLNAKKQCKIGDFGFAVYVGASDGKYVEKVFNPNDFNLSPETLVTKVFTVPNDVWAMGVLCWELFYITEHCNTIPPSALTKKHHQTLFQVKKIQLPKSKLCPNNLHRYVVNDLLKEKPEQRPSFTAIREKIKEISSNKLKI